MAVAESFLDHGNNFARLQTVGAYDNFDDSKLCLHAAELKAHVVHIHLD